MTECLGHHPFMLDASTPLIFPSLGPLYQTLAPWAVTINTV